MLIVTGYIHVDPSDLSLFHAELQAVAIVVRQRLGSLSYDAAIDDAQAGRLSVVERWHDQAALDTHLEAPEIKAFVQRWDGKMRGEIQKYDVSNDRDRKASTNPPAYPVAAKHTELDAAIKEAESIIATAWNVLKPT
ncbi:MAG: putative quinol monooxygenase [Acetobacter sp.]